jgi:type I restriction enzyme, R subunit
MSGIHESHIEELTLDWFQEMDWSILHGPDIAPDEPASERESYSDVVLRSRLESAIDSLNPKLLAQAKEEALRKVLVADSPSVIQRNRAFHKMLADGVTVEVAEDGAIRGEQVKLVDFENPDANDWLVVNQFTVMEGQYTRRPDIVVFVNGLPLAVIELKNPADENATIETARKQFETYKAEIPSIFNTNELLITSDGREARLGTITSPREWFLPWKTIKGDRVAASTDLELETLIRGVFDKQRFLEIIRHFIVFEDWEDSIIKKVAAYHQFHATQRAIESVVAASKPEGKKQGGVVWHTQGAGKSLTMTFFAGKLVVHPEMRNPTIVVITDRNDLDEQLFRTFCRCHGLLRQEPKQAGSREHLRELLSVASGGVVFSTIQKFMPSSTAPSPQSSPKGRGGENTHYRGGYDFSGLVAKARELRQRQTPAEAILWELLRNRGFAGLKFRRQHQIGDHIADFFCEEKSLVIDLDGPIHEEEKQAVQDLRRDAYLQGLGFVVVRFPTALIEEHPEQALERIYEAAFPSTFGRGDRGEGQSEEQMPLLTDRDNVVVIADEAHRSQYDFIKGFAKHIRDALPNATFIGFTGTPIQLSDRNTYAVFGDTISTYDIQQAVADKATVPIYYESRIAKLDLDEQEKPHIDEDLEEVTEGEEIERVERMKSKWSQLAEIVGTPKRLGLVTDDLLQHFDDRQTAIEGKALVVCMSRRICVDLYKQIAKHHPEWASEDDEKGVVKVVMSGSASDPVEWQQHIRNKQRRDRLAQRFKDPNDSLKIVIVRDMWLTGFDVPCLHTMYIDKPMKGHTLMQAIARVNRVFRDKPGGLIVDYIGLADALRKAMHNYTDGGGRGQIQYDQAQAVAIMLEKLEICRGFFHRFDYTSYLKGNEEEKLRFAPHAEEYILAQGEDGKAFVEAVTGLSKAFALAVPKVEAIVARDEVAFFQHVKASLVKHVVTRQTPEEELNTAVRQIVDKAIAPDRVIDILEVVGIDRPDISILSDEFLAEVRGMEHRNLAVEVLRKLLEDEIKVRRKTNLIQSRKFSDLLEQTIHQYKNRAIETLEVIEELIKLAKEMRDADQRGEKLGLSTEELAFYDALETNDSAVAVLGDEVLGTLARELADTVRKNATIDWTMKESVRARLRVLVKRTLRKYDYPPDKRKAATETVLQQAELIGEQWAK